jgi:lysyl-tRNA synthetase class 2
VLPRSSLLTALLALGLLVLVLAVLLRLTRGERWRRHVPLVAGGAALLSGIANLASAVSPADDGRMALLREVVGGGVPELARTLAVPAGVVLVLTGRYLARRHRRALELAVGALTVLAALNVAKGLDLATAAATAGIAAVLWGTRDAFDVEPVGRRTSAVASVVGALGSLLVVTVGVLAAVTWREGLEPSLGTLVHEALLQLTLTRETALPMPDLLAWLPEALSLTAVTVLLLALWNAFRRGPLEAALGDRRRADALIAAHGTDTLSGFARRTDLVPRVSVDGRAAGTCSVAAGVLFVGGAPSGPDDAVDDLLDELRGVADQHGLPMAILGASEELARRTVARGVAGRPLKAMYVGDEAVVRPSAFTLEGRPMKKVRQAVGRVERAGYRAEVARLGDLDAPTRRQVADVIAAWGEKAAHGFVMELPLSDPAASSSLVVLARDGDGRVRAFVHVVPTPAGRCWSLSSTPHERGLPNGVVDFLVVRMIERAAELGLERVSLNFAAYRGWIHEPATPFQRVMGRVVLVLDRFFQIERLHRFNQKFRPEWVPRYMLYDGRRRQLQTMWAAMVVEGQLRPPAAWTALRERLRDARGRRIHGPAVGDRRTV